MRLTDYTAERIADAFAILKDPSLASKFNYRDDPQGRAVATRSARLMIDQEACLSMLWPFHAVRRFSACCDGVEPDPEGGLVHRIDHEAVKASLERRIAMLERIVQEPPLLDLFIG